MRKVLVGLFLVWNFSSRDTQADTTAPQKMLARLADRFVKQELDYDPAISYSTGVSTADHSRFADRTPDALAAFDNLERDDLKELHSIDERQLSASDHATYANLKEQLESDLQLRVCKAELWNVNHFDGWQSKFAEVADRQPITTSADRAQALRRWSTLGRYLDVEIANLKLGLNHGYSAPQPVVRRVIKQMDQMAGTDPEKSPFYSPAARSGDRAFKAAFRKLTVEQINPAVRRYGEYLRTEYLPKARQGVAISDLPNGPACYQAFLRANTTLTRTPQQVFDLGQQTVNENVADVQKIGEKDYKSIEIKTILAAIQNKPEEHFQSKDELIAFSRAFLTRAKEKTSAELIDHMPKQDVAIQPLPAFEEAAGVGSRFVTEPDPTKPAIFFIQLGNWATETRAEAEITTVHETVPGHYLQKALARELQPATALSKFIDNAAYSEGWARNAEAMAEEVKIYDTGDAAILRRLWPARGMVADPGLHAFHWTRQQAVDYIMAAGRNTRESANDYVDRIAVMPGQLTSYDSGGLEIRALRKEAEAKLGSRFDLKQFDRAVLELGVAPLSELHLHVESWIERASLRN